jgi:hypothetical protein
MTTYPHTIEEINFATIKGDSYCVCNCGELLAEPTPEALAEGFKRHRKKHGLDSNAFAQHATSFSHTNIYDDFTPQKDYI